MLSVLEAIHGRQSVRAFLKDRSVDQETVLRILDAGARAPNGSNIQPWRVHVLTGAARDAFCAELEQAFLAGETDERDYAYYMNAWREPYLQRRRETGWGLYAQVGIRKGDYEATMRQQAANYRFFDAPVGLMITMDRDMGQGAWLDMGAFIQTVLLAARGEGLEACAQAIFCNYPNKIRALLDLPPSDLIVTGLAIGHPDRAAAINRYRTPRRPAHAFATFHSELPQRIAAE
ncbi:MAG: nitroreductase [Hyphomicrobiaceae bacterium]